MANHKSTPRKIRLSRRIGIITLLLGIFCATNTVFAATPEQEDRQRDYFLRSLLALSVVLSNTPDVDPEDDPTGFATFSRNIPIDQNRFGCALLANDGLARGIAELADRGKTKGIDANDLRTRFSRRVTHLLKDDPAEDVEPMISRLRQQLQLSESISPMTDATCATQSR